MANKQKYTEHTPDMVKGARVVVSNDTRKHKVWCEAIYCYYKDGRHYVHFGYNKTTPYDYRFCKVDNWKYSWEK